jgi:hypothetical protein
MSSGAKGIGWRALRGFVAVAYLLCALATSARLAVWIETDGDIGVVFLAVDAGGSGQGSPSEEPRWQPAQGEHDDPYIQVSIKADLESTQVAPPAILVGDSAGVVTVLAAAPEPLGAGGRPDPVAWPRPPPRADPALALRRTTLLLI